MSNDITVNKEFFEHLLNCMEKQKSNHPNSQGIYVGVSEPWQEVIDAAYQKARALLSQDSQGANPEALQFVSNVIELKPDKKYLMVFKDISEYQCRCVNKALQDYGFDCLCITLPQGHDVQVIEAPILESKPIPLEDIPISFDPDDYPLV